MSHSTSILDIAIDAEALSSQSLYKATFHALFSSQGEYLNMLLLARRPVGQLANIWHAQFRKRSCSICASKSKTGLLDGAVCTEISATSSVVSSEVVMD